LEFGLPLIPSGLFFSWLTSQIGAILVNINLAYRLHELEYVLFQSSCTAVVIAPEFKTSNYTQMMVDLAPELQDSEPGQLKAEK